MNVNRVALVSVLIGLVVLLGLGVLFFAVAPQEVSVVTTTTGIEVSSSRGSSFPFWLFFAIIPAVIVPLIAANTRRAQQAEHEKAKRADEREKPKGARSYTLGSDGELIEVINAETSSDELFSREGNEL